MDSYTDKNAIPSSDPLSFLNIPKQDLDAFLINTSGEMAKYTEEMHNHVSEVKAENGLDLDSLDATTHLGDVDWIPKFAQLDNDNSNDGNMVTVNPQSVFPMQMAPAQTGPTHTVGSNLLSFENANSAAMRLHANCSNLGETAEEESEETHELLVPSGHRLVRTDSSEGMRILSAVNHSNSNSPVKFQSYLVTARESPHKSRATYLVKGNLVEKLTIATSASSLQMPANFVMVSSPQKQQVMTADKSSHTATKSGLLSPSQASPVLLGRLQTVGTPQIDVHQNPVQAYQQQHFPQEQVTSSNLGLSPGNGVSSTVVIGDDRPFPKPSFSYSCLIALALKNSKTGNLPVSEIYNFMTENFPYFKTAPDGWKNSVRHNLSLNKCFRKVENPKLTQGAKKGCLWAMNPNKASKMEEEINKWGKKDPNGLLQSMAYPENLEAIRQGLAGIRSSKRTSPGSGPNSPILDEPSTPLKNERTPIKIQDSPLVRVTYSSPTVQRTSKSKRMKRDVSSEIQYSELVQPQPQPRHQRVQQQQHHHVHQHQVQQQQQQQQQQQLQQQHHIQQQQQQQQQQVHQEQDHLEQQYTTLQDLHSSLSTATLTDIVIQNGIVDSNNLENVIDFDFICDSPASSSHTPNPALDMERSWKLALDIYCAQVAETLHSASSEENETTNHLQSVLPAHISKLSTQPSTSSQSLPSSIQSVQHDDANQEDTLHLS